MSDSTTADAAPRTPPGPPPPVPPGAPRGSDRFYSWVSGLGIVRAEGWLGGVCGGIAARIRIDPIIVRGVFAVVAVLGFPALLVYAIGWALLPDGTGRIHLRETFRGRFDPAVIGIAIVVVLGFVPAAPWLWGAVFWPIAGPLFGTYPWDAAPSWGVSPLGFFGAVIAIVLVGGLVFLIARSARRGVPHTPPGDSTPAPRMASADFGAPGSSVEPDASGVASPDPEVVAGPGEPNGAASFAASGSAAWVDPGGAGRDAAEPSDTDAPLTTPPAPAKPPETATDSELAQWRAQHESWRAQDDAWRHAQRDADRLAREQARRERYEAGIIFAEQADERRRVRRASKPRTSFVFVVAALGAIAVAGAVASLVALGDDDTAAYAGAIGVLSAAIVAAVAMVVAGIARRRSGFLTFVTIGLVCVGLVVAVMSGPQALSIGYAYLGVSGGEDRVTFQPFGQTQIEVFPPRRTEDIHAGDITVRKGRDDTYIYVQPGTILELDAVIPDGTLTYTRTSNETGEFISNEVVEARSEGSDGDRYRLVVRNPDPQNPGVTTQHVHIEYSGTGSIYVTVSEPEEEQDDD